MKVFISADIEGVTGLASWSQCNGPESGVYDFEFARRMMTHDVNAAIRGAKAAGATYIVVKDAHNTSKNLLLDQLEPGTRLVTGRGSGHLLMMECLDASFDAAMLIGYHAMSGVIGGVMDHSIASLRVHRMRLNGREIGEIGISAGTAAAFGVPIVAVSSDAAGCKEAENDIPGVKTAITKVSLGRFMTQCEPPEETALRIEAAAKEGCLKRQEIKKVEYKGPFTFAVEFHSMEQADSACQFVSSERLDGYTVAVTHSDYELARRMMVNLLTIGGVGTNSRT
jgi:D-amino peptidase